MSSNVHTALSRNDWPLDLVYDLPSQSLQGDPSIDDPANDTGLGPRCDAFEVDGDFTIRRVTRPETLSLTVSGKGTGSGTIKGTMAIVRKPGCRDANYGVWWAKNAGNQTTGNGSFAVSPLRTL